MTFDPNYYEPKVFERDPALPEAAWIDRFVAHMLAEGPKQANEEFKAELPQYARKVAPTYLVDRKQYQDPEEAAWTDMSYWEDEE